MYNKKSFILVDFIMGMVISVFTIFIILNCLKFVYVHYNLSKNYIIEVNDYFNTSQRIKYDLNHAFMGMEIKDNKLYFKALNYSKDQITIKEYCLTFYNKVLVYSSNSDTSIRISSLIKEINIGTVEGYNDIFYIDFIYKNNTFRRYFNAN